MARPRTAARPSVRRRRALSHRQVNLSLEILVVVAVATGLVSWMVPIDQARILTSTHAISGFGIVLVAPLKFSGPVRTGFRRRRPSRWVSTVLGMLVLATVTLGIAHSTGASYGVGPWSPLWTHQALGLVAGGLLVWHVAARPVRPSTTDLDRRAFLTAAGGTAAAVGLAVAQEAVLDAAGWPGGDRSVTGSHRAGSYDPDAMPAVQWLDDTAPTDTDPDRWPLTVAGRPVPIDELRGLAQPLLARLDCTGGWYADQRWDTVPIARLLPPGAPGRSLQVTSATGYRRLFPLTKAHELHLAVGYDGRPLRRGHGAPVRLVAPGRRGPHWVKWVVDVAVTDRPAWLQLPLPPT